MRATTTITPPLIHEGRNVITPILAQKILETYPYKGQRPLHLDHVERWVEKLIAARGEFLENQGISFGVFPDGHAEQSNGVHRLTALAKSGKTASFDVTLYPVANDAEMLALYKRFDTETLNRSITEIVMNEPGVGEGGLTPRLFAKIVEAAAFIDAQFKNIAPTKLTPGARIKERQVEAAHDWVREARAYFAWSEGISAKRRSRFLHRSTIAVALVTLRWAPGVAQPFWERAIKMDGLKARDPALALREVFSRPLTRFEIAQVTAIAWNHEFNERQVQTIRVPPHGTEITIEGTPFE